MAQTLGKRKRVPPKDRAAAPDAEDNDNDEAVRAAFARAFEARFAPLGGVVEDVGHRAGEEEDDDEEAGDEIQDMRSASEDEDDNGAGFSGFSGDEDEDEGEDEDQIEVFSYTRSASKPLVSPADKRAFMSSKVPIAKASTGKNPPAAAAAKKHDNSPDDDDDDEATNLQNDLSLQRLLAESHLLHPSGQTAKASRQHRARVTDLRLQALGAPSILREEKMPMSMRKGISAKKTAKEKERRREAKEGGVILEKEQRERKKLGKRERSVGGPTVGKFKGGTLTLGRGDLRKIRGNGARGRGGSRGGRARGGSKRGRGLVPGA